MYKYHLAHVVTECCPMCSCVSFISTIKVYPRCPKGSQKYQNRPKCAEQHGNLSFLPLIALICSLNLIVKASCESEPLNSLQKRGNLIYARHLFPAIHFHLVCCQQHRECIVSPKRDTQFYILNKSVCLVPLKYFRRPG